LTWYLVEARSVVPLAQLVATVEADGFRLAGRPGKTASDALRSEIGRGRVVRVGRGRYTAGSIPRQTKSRIRHGVRELRAEIVAQTWDRPSPSVLAPPPANTQFQH
jgi:hypothetical protein